MLRGIECFPDASDIGADTCRRFVMRGEDSLDLVILVLSENVGILLERHARAPLFIAKLDLETHPLSHIDPEQRELSKAAHQNFVADGERVFDCRFPSAGAGRGENKYAAVLHLEDLLQVFENRQREFRKFRRAHILHGRFMACGLDPESWSAGDKKMRRNRH